MLLLDLASILLWSLLVLLGLAETYLLLLTAASLLYRRPRRHPSEPITRFGILVPAHNEEPIIEATLRSLTRLDYPAALFDIHVIADNCTDGTADLVRAFPDRSVELHERFDPDNRGKGMALRWMLSRLGDRYDAVVLLDADCVASPNLLAAFDARLRHGGRILQAWYRVAQPEVSWVTGLRFVAFALMNYVRPLGSAALGLSCGLYGTGMCFASHVLRHGWDSFSLIEDGEHHLKLLLDGLHVDFVPEAFVESPMPATLRSAHSQNLRWESGKLALARGYLLPLLRSFVTGRNPSLLSASMSLAVPPLTIHTALVAFTFAASLLLGAGEAVPVALALLAGLAVHVAVGLFVVRAPWRVTLALIFLPYFILWKLRLYLLALKRRGRGPWVRTSRSGEVSH